MNGSWSEIGGEREANILANRFTSDIDTDFPCNPASVRQLTAEDPQAAARGSLDCLEGS